jgi:hypothetical protein
MAGSAVATKIEHRPRGVVRTNINITTDASGNASATVVGTGFGRVVGVFYNGGLDASAVVTFSDYKTGATLFTYTTGTEGTPTTFRPTTNVVDVAGATISAATSAPNVNRDIFLAGKVSVTVASGGNAETGTFALLVDEGRVGDLALTV